MLYEIILCLLLLVFSSCSFDYGDQEGTDPDMPDIVMTNVEYVRVRSSDPIARFKAERAERYEERQIMKLQHFSFEQFGNHGQDVNALGRVGGASVEIDSGNISMRDGVRIEVDSEDLVIETSELEWKDKDRVLTAGPSNNEVNILQSTGTLFTGIGFRADARQRTWEFENGVKGTYVYEDKEPESTETGVSETGEGTAEE